MKPTLVFYTILLLLCVVYSQTTTSKVSADMICRSGCAFGTCGASSRHNASYAIASEASGYAGLYFEFPLPSIPANMRINRAIISFARISLNGIDLAPFEAIALSPGSFVNETSQSGSTADQTGSSFRCPGSIGVIDLHDITFDANGIQEAPLDVTSALSNFYSSQNTRIVINLTPLWDPLSGGFIVIQSRTQNADVGTLQISYDDGTQTTTTSAPTTTSVAPTTTTTTTSTPSAPITSTTTNAPVVTTSSSSAPETTTTDAPTGAPTTALPTGNPITSTTTDSPITQQPQGERNHASRFSSWAFGFVTLIVSIVILV